VKYQFLPNAPLYQCDIVIIPVSYEENMSVQRGTAHAPKAILKASEQIEYYDELYRWSPMQYMKMSVLGSVKYHKKREKFETCLSRKIEKIPQREKKLLIALGGDHSITPILTRTCMQEKGTIIFMDAHADLRKTYCGSAYNHACPGTHLLAQGHKVLMVGIRSLFEQEADEIEKNREITLFSDVQLQRKKKQKKLLKTISSLKGEVYLSIDMDVFNPSYVPSVATPQPGGIDWYFMMRIVKKLFLNKEVHITGVDMVELIPEDSNVSQVFAAKLLQKIISVWGKSQQFHTGAKSGSQMSVDYE